jgi:putative phosphoribosyl transferase
MTGPDAAPGKASVTIRTGGVTLHGDLVVPGDAGGIVVFAHGSGSSRHSPRNRFVAEELRSAGLGTLLFDLLTSDEERIDERTREFRFDIELLARRLIGVTDWLAEEHRVAGMDIGCFGASTGAAAALVAAAERPAEIRAVVSRGGRPDLATGALARVRAPTLLIVGGLDVPVIEMNRSAMAQMPEETEKELQIVPRATHLFPEEGALERVAELAAKWFTGHLGR